MRKSFVYAPLAGVRINRSPDCLTALGKRGQHMPIGSRLVDHGRRGPMQTNVILAGAAVPNADSAFSAPLQITPNVHLVIAWSPVVWDADRPAHSVSPRFLDALAFACHAGASPKRVMRHRSECNKRAPR